ncbi:hypothetical protein SLS62_009755 [Diatrype stigma]|uniref:Minor extracellular protease vpr n=1 Tax=Diatrype stigma TaxID=117547 RepID=A0AAN9YHY1_9PEZI
MRIAKSGLALLGLVSSSAATVADATTTQARDNAIVPGAYIVEFNEGAEASSLYDELRADGLAVDHRMDLNYQLFKGASFRLANASEHEPKTAAATVSKILGKAHVKEIWPVRGIQFPKLEPHQNGTTTPASQEQRRRRRREAAAAAAAEEGAEDTYSTHVMTQVDKLRAEGLTGKGIRIGVVDTGVDYTHPALGGCFGSGCRVAYGWDLTGDDYASGSDAPAPDPDPFDSCQGHGTHVAGIVMAQPNEMGFTGAAPDVTLGMYKVSGCPGYTTNEILIAAFNRAYEEGSDIISCSAGDDSGWAGDPWAVAASRIADAGVPVVVALGNSGNLGVWTAASPASGLSVAGIGSAHNTVLPSIVTAGFWSSTSTNGTESKFGWKQGHPTLAETNLTLPLWAASYNTTIEDDACEPLPDDTPDLSTSITLLRTASACQYDAQAKNVAAKGGKYIMFYMPDDNGMDEPYVYADGILGTGNTTPKQANEWIEVLKAGENVTLRIVDVDSARPAVVDLSNGPAAGYTSPLTSWGPTWEVEVKPQFLAPGGWILSTFPIKQGEYAVNAGTSMACPFAAAVFALVGEKRGTLDAHTLRRILSATSKPNQWNDETKAYDLLAPVAQQGAGLIQAYDAAYATVIPSVSSISFNDSDHFTGNHTFSLENTGTEDVTFTLGHAKSVTVYSYGLGTLSAARFPPPTVEDWAEITFETDKVTVPAGGSADVAFTAEPPSSAGLNATLLPVYGGYITLNGTDNSSLVVPYLGVAGSLYDAPILRPWFNENAGAGGVFLSSTDNHFNIPIPANTSFSIPRPGSNSAASAYPKLVVLPTIGSQELHIDVVPISGNTSLPTYNWLGTKSVGQLPELPLKFVPRTGYSFTFTGSLADGGVVEAGTYKLVTSALKIFGDANKTEDWEVVESVPFTLNYV